MKLLIGLFLSVFMVACTTSKFNPATNFAIPNSPNDQEWAERAADLFVGYFSNKKEASRDTTGSIFRAEMEVVIVPIWKEKRETGEYWVYFTQMNPGARDRPMQQQFFRLKELNANTLEVKTYALPLDKRGKHRLAWMDKEPLEDISPKDLIEVQGCEMWLVNTPQFEEYLIRHTGEKCPASTPMHDIHAYHLDMRLSVEHLKMKMQIFNKANQVLFEHKEYEQFDRLSEEEITTIIESIEK
ncbi:MAG: hypothetical protein GY810_18460 [Aureispira sp.]|nr:hypothetical protein [Aureispira sp.]